MSPLRKGQASPSGTGRLAAKVETEEDIDVTKLSREKIKQLMKGDPTFIGRLINQLDKQMHKMMGQKKARLDEIAADKAEIAALEEREKTHIQPHVRRLTADIQYKTELRDRMALEIQAETASLQKLQEDAADLIRKSRHLGCKLMRGTASQRLEEARGFSSTMPTVAFIQGKPSTNGLARV